LVKHHEVDSESLEFLGKRDQMMRTAGNSVELCADEHVQLAAPGQGQQFIEPRSPLLCATDPVVDELSGNPASRGNERPERGELILWTLLVRANPRVEGGSPT
jgi:hypothetical protein